MSTAHPTEPVEADWRGQKEFPMRFLGLAGLLLGAIFGLIAHVVLPWDRQRRCKNRVWCVCEVNGRYAFVPRDVYDRISRNYWKDPPRTETPWRGMLIDVPSREAIILDAPAVMESYTLTYGLRIEKRDFWFPQRSLPTPFAEAYLKMQGRPWDGKYLNW